MTITVHSGVTPLPWLVLRGIRSSWRALPSSLAAGLATLLSAGPLGLAVLTRAPGWLLAATGLPVTLALTAVAGFTAAVARGERARVRLDPVLALVLAAVAALAGLGLTVGGAGSLLGAATAAGLLLVGPLALGYGALRGRYGLSALRGGLILAAYRPLWALTLLGLGVLSGFTVVATAGGLALLVPPLLLSIAASLVRQLLDEIDAVAPTGERSEKARHPHRAHGSTEGRE